MASLGFHVGGGGRLFAVAPSHTHLSSKLLLHHHRLVQHHPPGHLRLLLPAKPTNSIDIYTPTTNWAGFAEKVSGEWDGYGADFTKEGEPIQLPESVVPEAFREWEVQVFDWQTQCPTLALPQPHLPFSYKLIRLLPTVGCEADAATRYSILDRNINTAMAFAYDESGGGSYVAVWAEDGRVVELEHCLVDPRGGETESRSRVRIIQEVRLMQLESISVFCEQWYGPFRNGDQLGGCAIRDSAFASTPPLQSSSISGDWHVFRHASATFHQEENMKIKQLVVVEGGSTSTSTSTRDGNTLILLPKQLWCSYHQQEDRDHETNCFQVGWLLDEGFAITSTCTFSSDANLKEIAITHEKLQT